VAAKKSEGIVDLPTPPLPKFLLDPKDEEYKAAESQTPDTLRAKMLLMASEALDIQEWHMRNMGDAKSSLAACSDLLDRAGFGKPKVGEVIAPAAGGVALQPIEDEVRQSSESFSVISINRGEVEE
jgi:hypothetical protein